MFRERYKSLIEQIHPGKKLIDGVLELTRSKQKKRNTAVSRFRKPVIAMAVACVCIFIAFPALASKVDSIYHFIYAVSPNIAQHFIPIRKCTVDNGIKLEVISSYIRGNKADIYIAMTDLEGNRIDGTIDLFDSYSINRPFSSAATCNRVDYDEATKTAMFLISITEFGDQNIEGNKITFTVKNFISNKKEYDDIEIPVDLSTIQDAEELRRVNLSGASGTDSKNYLPGDKVTVLNPTEPIEKFPVEGVLLTGVGYIDGRLHIQTAVHDNLRKDNHGYFYLGDRDGNIRYPDYTYNFYEQPNQSDRIDYCEYVFDILKKNIGNYSLYGCFVITGNYTEGNWGVTFPLVTTTTHLKN